MARNTNLPYHPEVKRLTEQAFARPADTTAYAAGDAVGITAGSVLTFQNATLINSGSGKIKSVLVAKSAASITNASFRLYLYNTAPTAIADNSAWTVLYADREKLIGYVDVTMVGPASGAGAVGFANVDIPFQAAAGSKAIYGVLVATAAYTPASAETFAVSLTVERY